MKDPAPERPGVRSAKSLIGSGRDMTARPGEGARRYRPHQAAQPWWVVLPVPLCLCNARTYQRPAPPTRAAFTCSTPPVTSELTRTAINRGPRVANAINEWIRRLLCFRTKQSPGIVVWSQGLQRPLQIAAVAALNVIPPPHLATFLLHPSRQPLCTSIYLLHPFHTPTLRTVSVTMGKPPALYSFPTTDDLAPNLRKYVLGAQSAALERHDAFKVAVSGGSLPKTLAKALLAQGNGSLEDTAQFAKWEIFFADERAVPLDHEDSNYKLLKDELLDKIPAELGQPHVYPIDESLLKDPQELADTYEQSLVKSFAQKDSVKVPLFDLLLLGCGPDGHTCSLFPGHALLRETTGWVLPIEDSPKPPAARITLSLPVVTAALRIAFVATGEGKKEILKQIFEAEEGQQLPCGLVNSGGQDKVSWFCDSAATDGVAFPRRGSL